MQYLGEEYPNTRMRGMERKVSKQMSVFNEESMKARMGVMRQKVLKKMVSV
jgi:hypothetical protein